MVAVRPQSPFRASGGLKTGPLRSEPRELGRPSMPPPAEIGCNANGSLQKRLATRRLFCYNTMLTQVLPVRRVSAAGFEAS